MGATKLSILFKVGASALLVASARASSEERFDALGLDALSHLQVRPSNASAGNGFKIDRDTGFFIDSAGRVRIFHGTNAVPKLPPYEVITAGDGCNKDSSDFQRAICDDDLDNLANKWGFNVIRLGVMMEAVIPDASGAVNHTYLEHMRHVAEKLSSGGISVLVDAHQDVLNRQFCGEGLPDWLVEKAFDLENFDKNGIFKFPFPVPFMDLPTDPLTGYPDLEKCQERDFGIYYATTSVQTVLKALYTRKEMHDEFAAFWKAVASAFKGMPGLLGYEIFNEPMNFVLDGPADLLTKDISDRTRLLPLYKAVHSAIRQVDDDAIIFYESMLGSEYVGLVDDRLVTDFTPEHSPGGTDYQDRQAYSYHSYCGTDFKTGAPTTWWECALFLDRSLSTQGRARARLGGAGILTEFGAVGYAENAIKVIETVTSKQDDALQGWMYWQFKSMDDITTSNPFSESFYHVNGTMQKNKVEALTRTYAQAVAGLPLSQKLADDKKTFVFVFKPSNKKGSQAESATTKIFLHGPPKNVTVQGHATYHISGKYNNFLFIQHDPSKVSKDTLIDVTVVF